jgi:hypothetical protein
MTGLKYTGVNGWWQKLRPEAVKWSLGRRRPVGLSREHPHVCLDVQKGISQILRRLTSR